MPELLEWRRAIGSGQKAGFTEILLSDLVRSQAYWQGTAKTTANKSEITRKLSDTAQNAQA